MPLDDRIEKPVDPNAPKVFDLVLCRKLVQWSRAMQRQPAGEIIAQIGEQLAFALNELGGVSNRIQQATDASTSFQRMCEAANAEVRVMQQQVQPLRDENAALKAEIETLRAAAKVAAEAKALEPSKKPKTELDTIIEKHGKPEKLSMPKMERIKRGKGNVVPMDDQRKAAQ